METTSPIRTAVLAMPLLFLAACGPANTQTRADDQVGLIAMATPSTDSPGASRATPPPARPAARFADEVLRDPDERFVLIERLRTRIVNETRQVPEPRWLSELRPRLRRQLENAGLARRDVDFLLWEVDQARPPAAE